jgi:predicted MFS family arabinose efflux permease
VWTITAAGTLAVLTITGHTNAWILLALTFILWLGNGAMSPAWSTVAPETVPREHLEAAIGLGSAGYNLARGFGAALGGLIVSSWGPGWAFAVNALLYLVMVRALLRWNYRPLQHRSSERVFGAMRAGLRYVKHSRALRAVLVRTVFFSTAVSILWSLLPLLARSNLHVTSVQYGLMVSAFGAGTLCGAFVLPRLRSIMSLDVLSSTGTLCFVLTFALLAFAKAFPLGLFAMFIGGAAWTIKNSALNVAVQLAAPNWVRARAYSVYLVVFQGCTALGAIVWGAVASWLGMSVAFLLASFALTFGIIAAAWFKLSHAELLDVNESTHWQEPELTHLLPDAEDGPVMVSVEYVIEPQRAPEFLDALKELEIQRRRDGAYQWHVFRDLADERRFFESFLVETWGEHVRQHERVLVSDRDAEQKVDAFHVGPPDRPTVRHFVAAQSNARQPGSKLLSVTQGMQPFLVRKIDQH